MSYDCSSMAYKNHDKTEGLAVLGIIKLRSTLLSGGKADKKWHCRVWHQLWSGI
jgi:hypothetical protein